MFDHKTCVELVAYGVYDTDAGRQYVYLYNRRRFVTETNWRSKLEAEVRHALTIEPYRVCVVAYEKCDDARTFADGSYAVVALEKEYDDSEIEWVGDEIAEEIQLW